MDDISQGMITEQSSVNEPGVFGSTLRFSRKKSAVKMHVPRAAVTRRLHPAQNLGTIASLDEDGACCLAILSKPIENCWFMAFDVDFDEVRSYLQRLTECVQASAHYFKKVLWVFPVI